MSCVAKVHFGVAFSKKEKSLHMFIRAFFLKCGKEVLIMVQHRKFFLNSSQKEEFLF